MPDLTPFRRLLSITRFFLGLYSFFFFNDTATTEIYTLSLHDALPIWARRDADPRASASRPAFGSRQARSSRTRSPSRSEEHTSELQSLAYLVCRLLLEKKKQYRTTLSGR